MLNKNSTYQPKNFYYLSNQSNTKHKILIAYLVVNALEEKIFQKAPQAFFLVLFSLAKHVLQIGPICIFWQNALSLALTSRSALPSLLVVFLHSPDIVMVASSHNTTLATFCLSACTD
ncbi:hypothetical protein GOP47_0023238 [Adiantum capillus-veneris]|uniref:Uncharacterized protein n=1 Tax=Adiantum capillus-veneris TaxID=13818 RepID=A0A9D4U8W5_ADICA|nr:hypothetical protein GOP47_0023238 [Adiantum capillus-veneris]